MIKEFRISFFFLSLLLYYSCKEPFDPGVISGSADYLIVEGIINPSGPTTITLTRTLKLTDHFIKNELKALVQIEGESNGVFPLPEKGNGLYSISQLNLNNSQKYRLRIKTSAGKEYLSDFVAVKATPPIDSVNWVREKDGVGIYVNAHDNSKNTRYYQWDYEETWEIQSYDFSKYETVLGPPPNNDPVFRARNAQDQMKMFTCWRYVKSSTISIGSTAKLSEDIIYRFPLMFIPNGSDKFEVKYSMLVRQYALSREAFEYLTLMKKNSEELGSFFDSQPSQLNGNIHSTTDPDETVIGYVQIAPVIEKRIFINAIQLPKWDIKVCLLVTVRNEPDEIRQYFGLGEQLGYGLYIPVNIASGNPQNIVRMGGAIATCMDCRLRGGNNDKPSFW